MDETADKKAVAADYMQSLRWFARMLWKAIPVAFVTSVAAQLLPAFIPALRILLVKELVDSLHAVYGQGAAGFELVVPILAMMVGLHMVGSLLGAVRDHARSLVRERTSWQLQELVLSRAASVRLSLFEDKAFFDRMQRAQWAAIWRGFRTFESALRIVEHFGEMTRGKSSVLISHRLGSARTCDRILVLKDGIVVEDGSHDELMASGGEYSHLFRLQAQWYE